MKFPSTFGLISLVNYFTPHVNQEVKAGQIKSFPLPSWLGGLNPLSLIGDVVEDAPAQLLSWVGSAGNHPSTPTKDAFYNPSLAAYQDLSNGDIIDIRPVGYGPTDLIEVSQAYQISYRTESTSGEPRADITTVLVPKNHDGKSLLSVQLYEDANSLKCAPSFQMLQLAFDPFLLLALHQGWMLNVPDHEGYYAAFTAGTKEGKSTLDSLRAVNNARERLGIHYEKVAMYGYSGGSIATGHALELQQSYAPDVQVDFAGMGGVIANLTATLTGISNGLFAGFAFGGILGMATEYPVLHDLLYDNLKPASQSYFLEATQHCMVWDLVTYFGQNPLDYATNGGTLLQNPQVKQILDTERLGHTAPKVPIFIHQGAIDEIANVQYVDALVDFYCQQGTRVIYHRDPLLAHAEEEVLGVPAAINYFKSGFAGFKGQSLPVCSSHQDAQAHDTESSINYGFENLWNAATGNYEPWGLQKV